MLSIVIPTYNRPKSLFKTLEKLSSVENIDKLTEILIIDNHSTLPLKSSEEFPTLKIRVIRNEYNCGLSLNIMNCFVQCKTKWFWLLSDDDNIKINDIQIILDDIKKCQTNTALIKYAAEFSVLNNNEVDTLGRYLQTASSIGRRAAGVNNFISNCVFNNHILRDYLNSGYQYLSTYVPHLAVLYRALYEDKYRVLLKGIDIVTYTPPTEQGYNKLEICLGLTKTYELGRQLNFKREVYGMSQVFSLRDVIKIYLKDFLNVPPKIFIQIVIRMLNRA